MSEKNIQRLYHSACYPPKKKTATRKATDNGKRLMLYSTDPSVITTPVMQEKKISWGPAKKRGSLPIFGA